MVVETLCARYRALSSLPLSPCGRGEVRLPRARALHRFNFQTATQTHLFVAARGNRAGLCPFPPRKLRGGGAPKGATTGPRLRPCGLRQARAVRKRASPLGAPPAAFLSPGLCFRAPTGGFCPPRSDPGSFRLPSSAPRPAIQGSRSSCRRTVTRGLPVPRLQAAAAGATPTPRIGSVLQNAPRVG
jgi:hypothetical protein